MLYLNSAPRISGPCESLLLPRVRELPLTPTLDGSVEYGFSNESLPTALIPDSEFVELEAS